MYEKPNVQHACCGALVTVAGKENGLPVWVCRNGHRLVSPDELTPRGSVFTPDRRFMPSQFADIRTARGL